MKAVNDKTTQFFLTYPQVGSVATEGDLYEGYMNSCADQVLHSLRNFHAFCLVTDVSNHPTGGVA